MSATELHDSSKSLSETLTGVADSLPPETVAFRDLLEMIGEQGLLLLCVFLSLPFLIPVSIPGVSTVFGAAIIFIGIGVTLNRVPWFPRQILDRPLSSAKLSDLFKRGAKVVARFEKLVKPRLLALTGNSTVNFVNGLAVILGGVLLIFPLGFVPFSNTLPAMAVLFLAMGMVERDGILLVAGHVMNVVTIIYFAALAGGVLMAGQALVER